MTYSMREMRSVIDAQRAEEMAAETGLTPLQCRRHIRDRRAMASRMRGADRRRIDIWE